MIAGLLAASASLSCSFATGSLAVTVSLPRETSPSVRARELDAVREVAAHDHVHAVGVDALRTERTVHIPEALLRELRCSPDLDGARVLGVHAPVRAVDVVGTPPGDHSRAELLTAQPARPVVADLRVHPLFGTAPQAWIPAASRNSGSSGRHLRLDSPAGSPGGPTSTVFSCQCVRCTSSAYLNQVWSAAGCRSGRSGPIDGRRRSGRVLRIVSDAGFCRYTSLPARTASIAMIACQ